MTREEIIQAISDDKMMPFIQPDQLARIVDFVSENYKQFLPDGLEEEIKRMVYDVVYDLDGPAIMGTSEYLSVEDIAAIARHFAEWGAEHLKK